MKFDLQTLIDLSTPQYLLVSIISPITAYMVMARQLPTIEIIPIIISLSLAVIWFNIMNMIFDAELDKLSKPNRPIPAGKVTRKEAAFIATISMALSLIICIFTNLLFFALLIVFFLVGHFYNSPRINFKKHLLASSTTGIILYGAIPFLMAYSIYNQELPIIFLVFFSILSFIIANSKDFEDYEEEKKLKISSFPIKFGIEKTAKLLILSLIVLLAILTTMSAFGIIESRYLIAGFLSILISLMLSTPFWNEAKKIRYKQIIISELKRDELKTIITQSDAVTIFMISGVIIQIIYGFASII